MAPSLFYNMIMLQAPSDNAHGKLPSDTQTFIFCLRISRGKFGENKKLDIDRYLYPGGLGMILMVYIIIVSGFEKRAHALRVIAIGFRLGANYVILQSLVKTRKFFVPHPLPVRVWRARVSPRVENQPFLYFNSSIQCFGQELSWTLTARGFCSFCVVRV